MDWLPEKKRTLPIVWSCLIRTHEHATEAEARACIEDVEAFLADRRRTPGPATAMLLNAFRAHKEWQPIGYYVTQEMVAAFIAEHEPHTS